MDFFTLLQERTLELVEAQEDFVNLTIKHTAYLRQLISIYEQLFLFIDNLEEEDIEKEDMIEDLLNLLEASEIEREFAIIKMNSEIKENQ